LWIGHLAGVLAESAECFGHAQQRPAGNFALLCVLEIGAAQTAQEKQCDHQARTSCNSHIRPKMCAVKLKGYGKEF